MQTVYFYQFTSLSVFTNFPVYFLPRSPWYSFNRPQRDERLSRPWGYPVDLNPGPQDWWSSALNTRPILHKSAKEALTFCKPKLNELNTNKVINNITYRNKNPKKSKQPFESYNNTDYAFSANPFLANVPIYTSRKPLVFWCFQGV